MVQKLMPGPASHLFLSSFSKATRRAVVAKAEEVGEQVRKNFSLCVEKHWPFPGEEGGDATGGEDQLAFAAGGKFKYFAEGGKIFKYFAAGEKFIFLRMVGNLSNIL